MSDQNVPKELSLAQFISAEARLPGIATLCLLLTTFLPCVILFFPENSPLHGWIPNGQTVSGYSYVGFWIFLPILAFGAATFTRINKDFVAYRKIADQIAFVVWAGLLVWVFIGGNMLSDDGMDFAREFSDMGPLFIILPHIGGLFFIAAPILLLITRRKEKHHAK